MDNQIKSFNDLPFCLSYQIGEEEYHYQPIIYKDTPHEFVAMYALMKDDVDDDEHRIRFEDFLFCVSGTSFEEAGNRLARAFIKEPVKSRIDGKRWILKPHQGKEKGFDMDEHVRPMTVEEE